MRFGKDMYVARLCVGSLLTTYNFHKKRKQETAKGPWMRKIEW
jgi:hypothetical protein